VLKVLVTTINYERKMFRTLALIPEYSICQNKVFKLNYKFKQTFKAVQNLEAKDFKKIRPAAVAQSLEHSTREY
jgi:hypothetical protein